MPSFSHSAFRVVRGFSLARRLLLISSLLLFSGCAAGQQASDQSQPARDASSRSRGALPFDPKVRVGTLENGLRFYVRENRKPEARAELRLVVNAGSVLEDEDQQGLAHFVEHMTFNGTRDFPKHRLVDYLESIGMRFGPDLNAYTGFDETVYRLLVPTDSAAALEQGFQILEDWAHLVSFEPEEIDKERRVVIEEWRSGRGADARMRDKQLPVLLKGSPYAQRLPIGQTGVVDTFHYDTLRRFYRDWYRPDLMAVVAVGDFDGMRMEELIRREFSGIPRSEGPRGRTAPPVPDHKETLFAIASDPEADQSSVSLYSKMGVRRYDTLGMYRQKLVEGLYNGMLNQRLDELTKRPDPPFLYAFSSQQRFLRSKEIYVLGAGVQDNGVLQGLEAILTEAARAQRHGFTRSELKREKQDVLRGMEQIYRERDKSKSEGYAREYVGHFLWGEPFPGIETEYELTSELIPEISVEEVNRVADTWLTGQNRVVLVNVPEKPGIKAVREEDLLAAMERVREKEIPSYEDDAPDLPLVEHPPPPAKVVAEKVIPELGVTEWTLENGVQVVLKPTDFKNDQILFTSYSPGGHSLVSDTDYVAAMSATTVLSEGGLGGFNQIQLEKKLSGKVVSVSPQIGSLQEGISGHASPKDLETMFQLIYLTFTAPRADSLAFQAYRARVRGFLENRGASPEAAFSDTLQVTVAQYHHRARPLSVGLLKETDLQRSYKIYQDRFADASDFTFFFVGNFGLEEIRPLVQSYLGGLPSINRRETWRDVGMDPPKGVIEKTVRRGAEPRSLTKIVFSGPFEWNRQSRYGMHALATVLEIKLREALREDLGGTYGVGVGASPSHYPKEGYEISLSFGCAPERVQELTKEVFAQIDSLKESPAPESYILKVKEMDRRERETNLKENGFWLNSLQWYRIHGEDPRNILTYADELIDRLTGEVVQRAARRYFDVNNYVRVVLYPEASKGQAAEGR